MYSSFEFKDKTKELFTTVTPYSLFGYKYMAMALNKPATAIAQEYILKTIGDLKDEGVEVYIVDVGIFQTQTYAIDQKVVQRFQEAGFKINPLKCE